MRKEYTKDNIDEVDIWRKYEYTKFEWKLEIKRKKC